ncbi:hypothetical protein BGZ61DRAFT_526370 [Ilyonectria robusta]|uniref:uncharacterized protein n=1 Tax=Ilyonectria robusta TaxID=1079257 RepID=UPI001E8E2655|nr:uncharacterized protein BGZ61DRAFT_526370 [Ilyonectria robusta]KAH8738390.1 hypothetical protein BGZ61DRAFT_526370 [Ilyonectria robusta]
MSSMSPTAVIAGEWVLLSLAIILVAARLYVRLYMNKDRIYWSDAWLLIAVCSALGLVICDTLAYKANAMFNFVDPGVRMLKIRFAVNYFFDTGMYFPKFSIIAFYYALVPPTQPTMRIALYTLTGITVASCLVTFFDATLWCGADIASNWSPERGVCSAYNSLIMMRIHWSLNFTTEVLNVAFPFPLIRDLKLPRRREKIGLAVILGLGVITIAISIGRFTNMVTSGNGAFSNYLWATSELCVSIILVALTALRPLLRKLAHIINSSINSSDYKSGYRGTSTDARSRTNRSKATHTQGSGAYWRTGTQTKGGVFKDDAGSEVQLNDLKSGRVMKTEEIRISVETLSNGDSVEYPAGPRKPMGIETSVMA